MKSIYDLKLHESMRMKDNPDSIVIRVAGGWIYKFSGVGNYSTAFVPFNKEFEGVSK